MMTIHYQYPGDPVTEARLMFGEEFTAQNPERYIAVISGGEETRIPIPSDEIVCDQCNAGVDALDPCVNTAHSLYCWTCAKENVLKYRVTTASDATQKNPTLFVAIRRAPEGYGFADMDSASADPHFALTRAEASTKTIPEYAKANPIVGVAQFDHVATHYI